MLKNEVDDVKKYLLSLIKEEEKSLDKDVKNFYIKHKIAPKIIKIRYFENTYEPFFLILKFKNYGIYFNDIEETFGICRVTGDNCLEHSEYYDNLKPTLVKFIDKVLK